jgi:hypothetical protein
VLGLVASDAQSGGGVPADLVSSGSADRVEAEAPGE